MDKFDDSDKALPSDQGSVDNTNAGGFRLPEPLTQDGEWPLPEPFTCELLPVPPLPDELIPLPFRAWVTDVSHRMQVSSSSVAAGVMVVLGAVIGTACGIRPKARDSWCVVPNLWGGIVSSPGKMKTGILKEVAAPFGVLEATSNEEFEKQRAIYEVDCVEYERRKQALQDLMKKSARMELEPSPRRSRQGTGKNAKTNIGAMAGLKEQLLALAEPIKPSVRRFNVNDATIEMLHYLLSSNPRGISVVRDELSGWLNSLEREDRKQDRSFYLESWNGTGSFTYDRIGRGSIFVKNLCVSVLGGIQPDTLKTHLNTAVHGGHDDGLFQRFQMFVYPDDIGWKYVDKTPNLEAGKLAYRVIEGLSKTEFTKCGATLRDGSPIPCFQFTAEAQDLFKEWITDLELNRLTADEEPIFIEHLAKYRSLMPTLALIDHLTKVISGDTKGDVCLESAERAAAWCDFLEQHARRIYGLVARGHKLAASKLSRRLLKRELSDGFTARDIYVRGWSGLVKADETKAALNELVLRNWLSEVRGEHTVRYDINPRIYQ